MSPSCLSGNRGYDSNWRRFLKGARRLHPPRLPSVLPWDLEVVLKALSQPPFEPLTSVGLKELSLKTVLLLALASAKRIGDYTRFLWIATVFASDPVTAASLSGRDRATCLNHYLPPSETRLFLCLPSHRPHVTQTLRHGCCPVRALRIYIDLSASFRVLWFVRRVMSKQRLSHSIVDAIKAAYTSQGLECHLHIRAHSTRTIAFSWTWSRGMSIQDICLEAGWSFQNNFARFYKLDAQSLASQVL